MAMICALTSANPGDAKMFCSNCQGRFTGTITVNMASGLFDYDLRVDVGDSPALEAYSRASPFPGEPIPRGLAADDADIAPVYHLRFLRSAASRSRCWRC